VCERRSWCVAVRRRGLTGTLELVDLALADDGPHDGHEIID